VTTVAKATPTVVIDNVVPTQTSIGFGITVTDVDQVGTITAIELYQGETLIEALTDLSLRTFSDLLSNNAYQIKVTYTYDLNDGVGEQELITTETVTTIAKATPEVVVDNVVPTQDSVAFDITVTDVDEVGAITAIELYQGETLIEALTDLSLRTFSDLLSNNAYQIKVTYTYDLNDGLGELMTKAANISIISIDLLNTSGVSVGDEISIRITLSNPDAVSINAFYVNGVRITTTGSVINSTIITFVPETNGGEYVIQIDGIEYNSAIGIQHQDINPSYEKPISIFGELNILSIEEVNNLVYTVSGQTSSLKINFYNPHNYSIDYLVLRINNMDYTFYEADFKEVALDFIIIELDNLYNITNRINATSVKFSANDLESKIIEISSVDLTLHKVLSGERIPVSTIEELANMNDNYVYELVNDIDAAGFNWTPKNFNGVLYGNGYSILNLSLTVNNQSTSSQRLGLFVEFSGAIIDLNMNNTYIFISTKGDVMVGTIASMSREYAQFINISVQNTTYVTLVF
jgi:hypothetical protein